MPGQIYNRIAELAADNYGYVTTEQAKAADINPDRLLELTRRGQIERCDTALYRVPLIPPTLVRPEVMRGTGFLGEHAAEVYRLEEDDLLCGATVPRDGATRRRIARAVACR